MQGGHAENPTRLSGLVYPRLLAGLVVWRALDVVDDDCVDGTLGEHELETELLDCGEHGRGSHIGREGEEWRSGAFGHAGIGGRVELDDEVVEVVEAGFVEDGAIGVTGEQVGELLDGGGLGCDFIWPGEDERSTGDRCGRRKF